MGSAKAVPARATTAVKAKRFLKVESGTKKGNYRKLYWSDAVKKTEVEKGEEAGRREEPRVFKGQRALATERSTPLTEIEACSSK